MKVLIVAGTNDLLKLRNQSEDFHPSAYQDDDDNDDGAEDDDGDGEDGGHDSGGGAETPRLINEEHKKKHAALFNHVNQLFDDCKNAWPPLPQFEQIVGLKKKAGESTEGVAAEKSNFLQRYKCTDENEYQKKRLARPPHNSYLMLRLHNSETVKVNHANGNPTTMGTLPVEEFKSIFTQYHQGELKQADGEAQLMALWAKKQFPANWACLPPKSGGKYPTLEQMAQMAATSQDGSSPAPAPPYTESSDLAPKITSDHGSDLALDLASDLASGGIRASNKVPVVSSCRKTTMPALVSNHTVQGQPIKAVMSRKIHGKEFYSFVVEVETNCFQTLAQSACGGAAVTARLSDTIKEARPCTVDEVRVKMGGTGSDDDKKQAANQALGEERGLLWVSFGPVSMRPTKMSTMLVNLYWKGPHGGSAIVTKSTLSSLTGDTAANAMIGACLGLKDGGSILKNICEKNPQIQPARDLTQKFNALALSAPGQASPRKGRGVDGMFRPIVIGYPRAEREVVDTDPDTNMKDAESSEEEL